MKEEVQALLSELEPASAQILFNALKNANDEGFLTFVKENFAPIKAWLKSDEFEKNFAHLPYPPLLNPSTVEVDKSKHCAELAWNLNLPISSAFNGGGGGISSNLFTSALTA